MKKGLTGNQLKLIALAAMTVDHVGMILFPSQLLFRVIGRLAFPVFAYMIAEGCLHTRSMGRYIGMLAIVAAVCQGAYFFAMGSLYQCIMVTFCLSVCLWWLVRRAMEKRNVFSWAMAAVGILAVFFITEILPVILAGTDFSVDYGFLGVILPVAICCGRTKGEKLCAAAAILFAMGWQLGILQWFSLFSLPLLALYNGQRGKRKLKYFFYIYYPAHLVIIYFASFLIF